MDNPCHIRMNLHGVKKSRECNEMVWTPEVREGGRSILREDEAHLSFWHFLSALQAVLMIMEQCFGEDLA